MTSLAPTHPRSGFEQMPIQFEAVRSASEPRGFDVRQVWVVLLHRFLLGLGVAVVVAAIVMAVVLQIKPTYQATATVLVEPNQSHVIREDNASGVPADAGLVDTQVEVIKTRAVAQRVVQRLKLFDDPEFNPAAPTGGAAATYTPDAQTLNTVVDRVAGATGVRRLGLTYVIEVSFKSHSPAKAARIANTFVEEYLAQQIQGKITANREANGWLNSSLDKLRADSLAADARVQQYVNAHNLMSSDGQTLVEGNVAKLNDQIATAGADTAEKQARLDAAEAQLKTGTTGSDVGAATTSETIRDLRKAEADTTREVAELSVTFGPRYPDLLRAKTKLADIHRQLQSETGRILSSLQADLRAARQRQGALQSSLGAARGSVVNNNEAQVQLIGLKQQAEAARKVYEAYLNRADQLAAQDGVQMPDGRMASVAAPPQSPISPKKGLAAVAAAVAGLIAGLIAALVAEFLSNSMRTRADVEHRLDTPFAGVIPDPARLKLSDRGSRSIRPVDLIVDKPFSSYTEAFRHILASLQHRGPNGITPQVVAVTSALPREGKSTTALCLTRALALSGSSVLLLDCDGRRSGLNPLVGDPKRGLGDILEGRAKAGDVIIQDPRTKALVLPWGQSPAATDLITTQLLDDLLVLLKEKFDYIVIDTPPVLAVADSRIIAAKADIALMVAEWNKTPTRAAESAVALLREAGVNLMGVALTKVNTQKQSHYGYNDSPYGYKAVQAYYAS
jgi:capsular exopolysaccharide synthesis family protein